LPSEIGDAPSLPPQGLLQSLTRDHEGRLAGYRIDGDGRYLTHPRGQGWLEDRILGPDQMDAVRRVIESSGLDGLRDLYQGEVQEEPATVLWVQVFRPGGIRTVTVVGDCRVPELERLTEGLVEVFRTG
jgi:hypothetical protein